MKQRELKAAGTRARIGAYSQAVEVTGSSRMLYISGQLGINPDGSAPPEMAAPSRCRLPD